MPTALPLPLAPSSAAASASRAFHLMAKPIGPICNLDCKYCFYLEKEKLYPETRQWKMSDAVLEAYVRQYIEQQDAPEINFAWQGGEPTLLGVEFFEKAVALQQRYASGKRIANALQTNGTLLDDRWGAFLAEQNFLVGLSIDGPRALHDAYRLDKQQRPTFDAVMRGLEVLKKHRVEFNTLTVVNRQNSQRPMEVYRFLKQIGSGFLQFIPLVERVAPTRLKVLGFELSDPPTLGSAAAAAADAPPSPVTPWSVEPVQYGRFLCEIFDHWVRHDVGKVFVQMFDVALGNWMGLGSSLCVFAERCGAAMAIEHNGDVYSCDHYVYPRYRLGNVLSNAMGEMAASPAQQAFGSEKSTTLPDYCRRCEVRFACHGECPKHRFANTPDGQAGLNYLCPAYKRFFNHIDPYMKTMAKLLQARRPPAAIMEMLAAAEREATMSSQPGRNDPCACGSGLKFKKCCGGSSRP